jgi:hypothetical protein
VRVCYWAFHSSEGLEGLEMLVEVELQEFGYIRLCTTVNTLRKCFGLPV